MYDITNLCLENQKKIWITGASSGIGKALALKFAKENWQVAISARRKELLDELAQNENISLFLGCYDEIVKDNILKY